MSRIVGVIRDMRFRSAHDPVRPTIYYYFRHDPWPPIAAREVLKLLIGQFLRPVLIANLIA